MKSACRPVTVVRNVRAVKSLSSLALTMAGLFSFTSPAWALPLLGADLASFTVLGASTVTNVPTSVIVGNVGVWSSGGANAITGFNSNPGVPTSDPQVTGGLVHAGTTNAMQAQLELVIARNNLASLGAGTPLAADLVGLTLTPGIYTVPAGTTNLSGTLTLDGGGNANAAWIFQMESTLITSPNSVVNMVNAGNGAGLYWNVASSATIDVNTTFLGNILALESITMNTSATDYCGRALADTGAVTLQQNSLSGICSGFLAGSDGLSGGLVVTSSTNGGSDTVAFLPVAPVDGINDVSEPGSLALVALGITAIYLRRRAPISNPGKL